MTYPSTHRAAPARPSQTPHPAAAIHRPLPVAQPWPPADNPVRRRRAALRRNWSILIGSQLLVGALLLLLHAGWIQRDAAAFVALVTVLAAVATTSEL